MTLAVTPLKTKSQEVTKQRGAKGLAHPAHTAQPSASKKSSKTFSTKCGKSCLAQQFAKEFTYLRSCRCPAHLDMTDIFDNHLQFDASHLRKKESLPHDPLSAFGLKRGFRLSDLPEHLISPSDLGCRGCELTPCASSASATTSSQESALHPVIGYDQLLLSCEISRMDKKT